MQKYDNFTQKLLLFALLSFFLAACQPSTALFVPTDPPSPTVSLTPSVSPTGGALSLATFTPIAVINDPNAPTATSLFGATRTPLPDDFPTPTRAFNPNAPRIDFFTSDPLTVAPGGQVTLFWATRNVENAVVYRLDSEGNRAQANNVSPDGNLPVTAARSERNELRFILAVGDGANYIEQLLVIPLECPDEWFFVPAPNDCALNAAQPTLITDMTLERGRMLYVAETNTVYVLFNDGLADRPAWRSFENRFNPEIHPAIDENAPIEWIQPRDELGFVWRGDGDVRVRLGLGLADAVTFEGFIQEGSGTQNNRNLYLSGANGVVLQLIPGGDVWQIIGGPR